MEDPLKSHGIALLKWCYHNVSLRDGEWSLQDGADGHVSEEEIYERFKDSLPTVVPPPMKTTTLIKTREGVELIEILDTHPEENGSKQIRCIFKGKEICIHVNSNNEVIYPEKS